jgi:hypothetical protein
MIKTKILGVVIILSLGSLAILVGVGLEFHGEPRAGDISFRAPTPTPMPAANSNSEEGDTVDFPIEKYAEPASETEGRELPYEDEPCEYRVCPDPNYPEEESAASWLFTPEDISEMALDMDVRDFLAMSSFWADEEVPESALYAAFWRPEILPLLNNWPADGPSSDPAFDATGAATSSGFSLSQ